MENFGVQILNQLQKHENYLIFRNRTISHNEFILQTRKFVTYLDNLRSRKNCNRLATFCTNSPEFLQISLASQISGFTLIPLNPSYKKYEIEMYLRKCDTSFAIISDDLEDLDRFSNVDFQKIGEILEELQHVEPANLTVSHQNGIIQFFSSGTTGPPKLIEYTQQMMCAQLEQLQRIESNRSFFSPRHTDICYGVLPYFHAGGLLTILAMLWSGTIVVINERWNEMDFLDNVQRFSATILFIVPPVLNFLATHPRVNSYDLSSIETIYVGSAASRPEHFKMVLQRLPRVQNLIQGNRRESAIFSALRFLVFADFAIFPVYGTTECGILLCSTMRGVSSGENVGFPFPGVEIKIEENTSRILIKSTTAFEPGFIDTGDLGRIEKNGELKIIGRSKEMIKVRGWQVNPNEIEDIVRNIDQVVDCAVFQNPKDSKLVAKVIRCGTHDNLREIIIETVKKCLASYKHVHTVVFVSSLPKNSSGKLVRRELVD